MPLKPSAGYRLPTGWMRSVGSFGIRHWAGPLRTAAAQARTVLIEAAAARWAVDPALCRAENGQVVQVEDGRALAFAELVADAVARPLPAEPTLKPEAERKLVGTSPRRLDTQAKITGAAVFGVDVHLPDMLHGAVRLSPVFAAEVERIDEASVASMQGVVAVVPVPHGAVVVATDWWRAKQAADALSIAWKPTPRDGASSESLSAAFASAREGAGLEVLARGEAIPVDGVISQDYEVPFLTHVCMEPLAAVARVSADTCELWMATQAHDNVRLAAEGATGLPSEAIEIHTTYLGGGFGRKTHGETAIQAILASKAVGGRPVKVIWAREDDDRQGQYRPAMSVRMAAKLDGGRVTHLMARLAGPMMGRQYAHVRIEGNRDPFSVAGLADHKYAIPNFRLEHAVVDVPPPVCPWRAVASSHNGFFVECFIDELAHAAGADPIAFRKAHLANERSFLAVLESVERRSGWGTPLAQGRGRGVAVVESYNSRCAQVIEVEMVEGRPVVRHVFVALDCGEAVHPGQVEQQAVGAVIEGLSAALWDEITLKDGRAQQSNFTDYRFMRMPEVPPIELEIVRIGSPLGGVGEPILPPTAPALANAIFAATGTRLRTQPVSKAFPSV